MENLKMTNDWDKVFPKSDKVNHSKITFHNRYGITLAADMYVPKNAAGRLPAIAVCGPFGAVKEQSSGLYAQTMAEYGFLSLLIPPLQVKAAVYPGMWHLLISTPKTFALRLISCLFRKMLTLTVSESSASADGAVWQSMLPLLIHASKQLLHPLCMI